jgi:hypothetical protein
MSEPQTAVLDAKGVYIGMRPISDDLPEGCRRVASIMSCDLPVGEYVWIDDEGHPFGGFFWPVSKKLKLFPGVK